MSRRKKNKNSEGDQQSPSSGKSREEFLIRKALLKEQDEEIQAILQRDPDRPIRERESDRQEVLADIAELRTRLEIIKPFVRRMRGRFAKISEESVAVACYLLFSQTVRNFEALLLLASRGLSFPASQLIRLIIEGLDLAALFREQGETGEHLKKWFGGGIVLNHHARKVIGESFNRLLESDPSVEKTKARVYSTMSTYSHMGLFALLDSVDVFTRDFDWGDVAAFHYLRSDTLPLARATLKSLLLQIMISFTKDGTNSSELASLYRILDMWVPD